MDDLNEFIRPSTQSLYLAVSFILRLYTATKGVNRQNVIIQLVSISHNVDKINTNCLFLLNIIVLRSNNKSEILNKTQKRYRICWNWSLLHKIMHRISRYFFWYVLLKTEDFINVDVCSLDSKCLFPIFKSIYKEKNPDTWKG